MAKYKTNFDHKPHKWKLFYVSVFFILVIVFLVILVDILLIF